MDQNKLKKIMKHVEDAMAAVTFAKKGRPTRQSRSSSGSAASCSP